ncbi:MAG: hypothetical protein J6A15_02085 [Clostridia bacterium]|nr:hypothetical protein [Clostridia bacterium]
MNDNKRKIVSIFSIIVVLLIVVIIIAGIIIISNLFKDDSYERDDTDRELRQEAIDLFEEKSGKIVTVSSMVDFNTVKACIQKFYSYYPSMYDEKVINGEYGENINLDYYKQRTYYFLSSGYCTRNDVTLDNINSKLPELKGTFLPEIYSMYYITYDQNVKLYFVTGMLRDESNKGIPFSINVYMDTVNNYFEIDLDNLLQKKYDELKVGEEITVSIPENVLGRTYNKFGPAATTYGDFSKMLFDNIVNLLLYNPDKAYELLSEAGKARFSTVEDLRNFVTTNKKEILLLSFKMYENNYVDGKLNVNLYDKNSEYIFNVILEDFSSFKFSF